MNPSRGFFRHPFDLRRNFGPALCILGQAIFQKTQYNRKFFIISRFIQNRSIRLSLNPFVDQHGRIPTVIHDQIRSRSIREQ